MEIGEPRIDSSAKIATNATIVGDVAIGSDVTVMYGAVIRGDCNGTILIGDRSNIQDLACIHVPLDGETIIGSEVSIGHGAILHGCSIGDGTVIGMGSILLDGAQIGRECLVGAGSLVTGGMESPDRVLIMGSPAKVVRELTVEEASSLKVNCEEYIKIGRELEEKSIL